MDKPNVLVIMTDQMKASALAMYSEIGIQAPNLERMAREGVLYQNAFTPHPLCAPARCSFWTSQYSHQHGCRRNETLLPNDAVHAFKIWKQMGYHNAMIGKNHCFVDDYFDTFDTWCELGHGKRDLGRKNKGMEWLVPVGQIDAAYAEMKTIPWPDNHKKAIFTELDPDCHTTGLVGNLAVKFIEKHQGEPFAAWVSFPCPHEPYVVPKKYADMIDRTKIKLPPWEEGRFDKLPERNRLAHRLLGVENEPECLLDVLVAYYANILFIDEMVGKMLDTLDRLGLRKNTIVVFCSDHGDYMGEHRMTVKGGTFYDCLVKVPMLVSCPGTIPMGVTETGMVSLIDVVPTLLHMQGAPIPRDMYGKLLPTVCNVPAADAAFAGYGAGMELLHTPDFEKAIGGTRGYEAVFKTLLWREAEGRRKMVRTHDWKYVHDSMGDLDELYDLKNDPWELDNKAADPRYQAVLSDLQRRLMDWSLAHENAKPVPLP